MDERKKVTDDYLREAGFDLENNRADADEWLKTVIRTMRRGKFEDEVGHLQAAIDQRKAA